MLAFVHRVFSGIFNPWEFPSAVIEAHVADYITTGHTHIACFNDVARCIIEMLTERFCTGFKPERT